MALSNLDNCLFPGVNFTHWDEITFDLVDIIKCPILLESSGNMVIFNQQFYDRESFDSHQRMEQTNEERSIRRGDVDHVSCLKDPRTGQNVNPTFVLISLFHSRPNRSVIAHTINRRIPGIMSDEINDFLPNIDDITTNTGEFVAQITAFAES